MDLQLRLGPTISGMLREADTGAHLQGLPGGQQEAVQAVDHRLRQALPAGSSGWAGIRAANSSPPRRATTASGPRMRCSCAPLSTRIASPTTCPNRSLIRLKRSRSIIMIQNAAVPDSCNRVSKAF